MVVDEVRANSITFRVVLDDAQTNEVIVGSTFTELPHIVYYKVDDTLTFSEKKIKLPFDNMDPEEHETTTETLKVIGKTMMAAGTVNLITTI